MNERLQLHGKAEIVLRGPDGRIKEHHVEHNLIVDIGFDNLNSLIRGSGGNALTHLGIGWAEPDQTPSGPAAGDVNIPSGGNYKQDRVASVLTRIDEKNWKLVSSWGNAEPASAGSFPVPIRSIGAFWASGTGDNELFAWILRAVINKASADTLEVTYTFTMS
jgi:hypothetical protein